MFKYIITTTLMFYAALAHAQSMQVTLNKTDKECIKGYASVVIEPSGQTYNTEWSTGATTNSVQELDAGNYTVTVTDAAGNDTTINFSIDDVECLPSVATNFTPNDDGFNDTWAISRLGNFPDFELIVYNRWGQRVHYQTGQYIPWDGRNLGLPLPDATYYYIIYLSRSDKKKIIKGDVSILR